MPATFSPTSLANRVQQLLDDREQHTDAIEQIDATLEQLQSLLGISRPGRKRRMRAAASPIEPAAPRTRKRGRRGGYATTAIDSILAFVQAHGDPTTQEIRALWREEGRGGTADNVLSKMVKEGQLKRTPMKDQRGSRYSLA